MFSDEEGAIAVHSARSIVDSIIRGRGLSKLELPPSFDKKGGIFTTLSTFPDGALRGCIGIPEPVMPLKDALVESAVSAATRDPRFPAVTSGELDHITVEVTLLTPPEPIETSSPEDLLEKVNIGEHGLIAQRFGRRGLLLPQVPVEQGWDTKEFLEHTCWKAGLPMDSWKDPDTSFLWFTGQVFTETEPGGDVRPKPLTSER